MVVIKIRKHYRLCVFIWLVVRILRVAVAKSVKLLLIDQLGENTIERK